MLPIAPETVHILCSLLIPMVNLHFKACANNSPYTADYNALKFNR